jgi:hypothetical protein
VAEAAAETLLANGPGVATVVDPYADTLPAVTVIITREPAPAFATIK